MYIDRSALGVISIGKSLEAQQDFQTDTHQIICRSSVESFLDVMVFEITLSDSFCFRDLLIKV